MPDAGPLGSVVPERRWRGWPWVWPVTWLGAVVGGLRWPLLSSVCGDNQGLLDWKALRWLPITRPRHVLARCGRSRAFGPAVLGHLQARRGAGAGRDWCLGSGRGPSRPVSHPFARAAVVRWLCLPWDDGALTMLRSGLGMVRGARRLASCWWALWRGERPPHSVVSGSGRGVRVTLVPRPFRGRCRASTPGKRRHGCACALGCAKALAVTPCLGRSRVPGFARAGLGQGRVGGYARRLTAGATGAGQRTVAGAGPVAQACPGERCRDGGGLALRRAADQATSSSVISGVTPSAKHTSRVNSGRFRV